MEVTYDYYRIFYYAAKYKSFSQAATILMKVSFDADYLSGLTGEQSLHRRENGFIHMLQLHTIICMQQS